MVEKTKKVWMNGSMVDWDDANVHVTATGLHYGYGVFEGTRCYKLSDGRSAIFRLPEHIRRLTDGCKILMIKHSYSDEDLIKACVKLVKFNGLSECYVRPMIFDGVGTLGLHASNPPQVVIISWKWGEYLGKGALMKGTKAKVSTFSRHHVNVSMVKGKITGQYVSSVIAKREAIKQGYDEAIMLDVDGYVTEGTGENLFAVRDGIIYTAPLGSSILPGITRDCIITIAGDLGFKVREEKFTRDFLYICDELFFTGSAAEVSPIREVDERSIGNGGVGPITKRLQDTYFSAARGKDEKYKKWLTIIR